MTAVRPVVDPIALHRPTDRSAIPQAVARDAAGEPSDHIRTRDRVRELAEVYTQEREVVAMLDLIPDTFPSANDPGNHDRTFLEPACGHGNFLSEILQRKLQTVTSARYKGTRGFEQRVLRCLASIYGIDVDKHNVLEARDRMRKVVLAHGEEAGRVPTDGFLSAVEVILGTNIIWADALATTIEVIEYRPGRGGTFLREWSPLTPQRYADASHDQLDLFGRAQEELDLFATRQQHDAWPVHYRDLARYPRPTRNSRPNRRP